MFCLEIGADIGVKLQALTGTFEQLKAVRNILELRDNVTLIDPGASVPFHSKIFRQFESTIKQQFALFKLDTSDTIKKRWFSRFLLENGFSFVFFLIIFENK